MARPQAEAKLCFYPAHPLAIEQLSKHLFCRGPDPTKKWDTINILDPCAGKGEAIQQLAIGLGVPETQVYTVELDGQRSEDIKALMPKSQHLGPASFAGVQITGYSFGLVYLNPPYGHELGGGKREEYGFTEIATRKLVAKGILVLVCPIQALVGKRDFVEFLDSNYEEIAVYKFPDGVDEFGNEIRPYKECVVVGKKRKEVIPRDVLDKVGSLHKMKMQWQGYVEVGHLPTLGTVQPKAWLAHGGPSYEREEEIRTWEIPHSWKPHVFKKTMFTELELEAVVAESPLNSILKEVKIPPPNAPPLPLDKGHLGLILASGMLDGVVEGPHGVHIVRGSSHKVEYHNKALSGSEVNPDSGAVKTVDTYSQRMVTVIRVVEQDGVIGTFSNEPKEEKDEESDYNGDVGVQPGSPGWQEEMRRWADG
jgi:Uncharacterised methyltransferase family (DUF6094)